VVPGAGLWREGVVPSAMLKHRLLALEVRNRDSALKSAYGGGGFFCREHLRTVVPGAGL
jgi:hypothetical protein